MCFEEPENDRCLRRSVRRQEPADANINDLWTIIKRLSLNISAEVFRLRIKRCRRRIAAIPWAKACPYTIRGVRLSPGSPSSLVF